MASLGNDLATIRKRQNLTLEDIHNITKIPPHILRAIEDETIFSDFAENKTYIRSYIRSFGKAIHIDDELVVNALDTYEDGDYTGQLLGKDTGESDMETPEAPLEDPDTGQQDEDEATLETHREESMEDTDMIHDHAPEDSETEDDSRVIEQKQIPKPPAVGTVDWADMGRKFSPLQPKSRMWIGVTAVLLILLAVIFFWFYQSGSSLLNDGMMNETPGTTQSLSQPAVVPDSLQLNLADSEEEEPEIEVRQSLADTLEMLIYAAHGKLEPVRVYTDVIDELNPYWIEEGEAVRFEFVNLIRFRGQYSRMELLLNGHPIRNFQQQFYNPDTTMVVIERSYFENDERWLQPPPDSTELNFLPPTLIRNRPMFN